MASRAKPLVAEATAPANDAGPQILFLKPGDIHVGERIGMFWPDKAAALGKLIATDGQNDPIKVHRNGNRATHPWSLVAGLHRLKGVEIEHLAHVEAIEVVGTEEQLLEIQASENIHRRTLPPIERACFVHAIAEAAERRMQAEHGELTQQQIAVRARWDAEKARVVGTQKTIEQRAELEAEYTTANLSAVYSWQEGVAEAMGLSARAVRRDLALYRGIVEPFPHLAPDLARHPIVGENASALSDIVSVQNAERRRDLIVHLIKHPAMTVAEARIVLGIDKRSAAPGDGASKFMDNLSSNLRRLSAGQQASYATTIVKEFKPSALIALRDAVNERLARKGGKS